MAGLRFIIVTLVLVGCSGKHPLPTDIPAPPDASAPVQRVTQTFAVDALFFGEAPLYSGSPSQDAWINFGYDLDGLITTSNSSDVCSGKYLHPEVDGFEGIDNSFAHNVLPTLVGYIWSPFPSGNTTAAIRDGARTVLIQVSGLQSDDASVTGLTTDVFVGGAFGNVAPALDATTDWPVLARSLADGKTIAGGARLHFDDSYMAGGTFVSGAPVDEALEVPLSFGGSWITVLRIHHATITFERSSKNPTRLAHGIIAGVLDPFELDAALTFYGSGCNGASGLFDDYVDILHDRTNARGVACDAISIGLAFTAVQVANPTQVTTTDVAFDPCGP